VPLGRLLYIYSIQQLPKMSEENLGSHYQGACALRSPLINIKLSGNRKKMARVMAVTPLTAVL